MTAVRARPKRIRNVTEKRLRAGAVVLKTSSPDAKHGAFWTYPDTGHLAAANVCHRLERLGLLESDDALFPGEGGQTYRYAPPPPSPPKIKPPKVRKRWSDPGATA